MVSENMHRFKKGILSRNSVLSSKKESKYACIFHWIEVN